MIMLRLIVLTYRLIPCRIRRLWSRGTSTSHLALDGSWHSFWGAVKDWEGSGPHP